PSACVLSRSLALPEMSPSRFVDPSLCNSLTMVAPYTACPPPPRYRRPTLLPVAMMGPFQRKLPLMSALPFSMMRMPVPLLCPETSSEVNWVLRSVRSPLIYMTFGFDVVPQQVELFQLVEQVDPMSRIEYVLPGLVLMVMSAY